MSKCRRLRALLLALALSLMSACASLSSPRLPSPIPSDEIPTVVALTVQAQVTLTASAQNWIASQSPPATIHDAIPAATLTIDRATQSAPTSTVQPPSPTPASAVIPASPQEIPFAAIQIINPGPASRLVSPFLLKAVVRQEPQSSILIELVGEDGRLLMREVRRFTGEQVQQVTVGVEVNFQISAAAEAGRLQISVTDREGRLSSLASTDLILLSLGKSDVNPVGDLLENIAIQSPRPNLLIQGGMVRVDGLARTRTGQPLRIELETAEGKIVGSRQVAVTPVPGASHGTFAIDVPYTVDSPTRVRVKVWEPGDRVPGIIHLSSVEVLLSP